MAKSQKALVIFFKPVINFFVTSDLFSLITGLNHWFLGPVFHMDAPIDIIFIQYDFKVGRAPVYNLPHGYYDS